MAALCSSQGLSSPTRDRTLALLGSESMESWQPLDCQGNSLRPLFLKKKKKERKKENAVLVMIVCVILTRILDFEV